METRKNQQKRPNEESDFNGNKTVKKSNWPSYCSVTLNITINEQEDRCPELSTCKCEHVYPCQQCRHNMSRDECHTNITHPLNIRATFDITRCSHDH